MRLNKTIDAAVKEYAAELKTEVSKVNNSLVVDVVFHDVPKSDKKQTAHAATVLTDIGAVIIFPDFRKKTAVAVAINIGLLYSAENEGFTDKEIEDNIPYFGKKFYYRDKKNVKSLVKYLTVKQRHTKEKA